MLAHRYYQFAMCMYKIWRYKNGDDLLVKMMSNNQKKTKLIDTSADVQVETSINAEPDYEMHEQLLRGSNRKEQRNVMGRDSFRM